MKKLNKKSFFLIMIVLLPFMALYLFNFNKPSNWLIFTPKPIGTYEKYYSESLFTFGDNKLFFNDQSGNIYSVDKETGKIIWSKLITEYSPFTNTLSGENKIAFNSFDMSLYMFNTTNGAEEWRFINPNNSHPDTPAVTDANDENIFFGDRVGSLYAIDKLSGKKKWERKFKQTDLTNVDFKNNSIHFGKIFQDDNNIYLRSATESKLFSINKNSGEIFWEKNLDFSYENIVINDKVVIASDKNEIKIIDKNNGQVLWTKKYALFPNNDSIFDEYLYLVSEKQKIEKINLLTGEIYWEINTNGEIKPNYFFHKEIGFIFNHVKGYKNKLIVFNKSNGEILWEFELSSDVITAKIFGNNLLLGSVDGHLYKIDYINKMILNQIFLGGKTVDMFEAKDGYIVESILESDHALFTKLSEKTETIWSYKTPYKVADKSIFFNEDRLFFTDEGRRLLGSIDTKTNHRFDKNDFSLDMIPNKNKTEILEMSYFFDNLMPEFLEKLDYKYQDPIRGYFNNYADKYKFVKKNDFEIIEDYDQSILEITLLHQLDNKGNPIDQDIKISAVITSPSGEQYDISGFPYEKNTWKLRFRPNEIGTWKYKLSIKSSSFLNKVHFKKEFNVNKASMIKYVEVNKTDPLTFSLEDGSEFYPLGIEDVMLDYNFDGNPINQFPLAATDKPPEKQEDVDYVDLRTYFQQYSDSGFNLYRWGVGNASFSLWKEQNNYPTIDLISCKYGDDVVKELRAQNYHIMMTVFGFYPPYAFSIDDAENQKAIKDYLDIVVSRYASYVDIWEISNEAEVSDEWLNFVTNYIKQIDPYHHPITTNWDKPQMKSLDLLSYHWYGSESIFETALTTETIINNLKQFNKPLIFSEVGNINYSWDENSAERMRIKLWTSFFNQAYLVFWNQPGNIYQNEHNANIYLGPKERNFTKIFSNITNSFESELKPFALESQSSQIKSFGLKSENKAYLYISKIDDNGKNEVQITFPFTVKNIQWIDPSSGNYLIKLPIKDIKISLPSFNQDIVGEIEL